MLLVLTILCLLVILFAGSCAIAMIGAGVWPLAAIPFGIVAVNVLVILSLRGRTKPAYGAFATLAGLDLVIGAFMLFGTVVDALANPFDFANVVTLTVAGAIIAKGALTVLAAWALRRREAPTLPDEDPQTPR